jgi:hypothetical protein
MAATTAMVVGAAASAYSASQSGKKSGGSQTTEIPAWQRAQIERGYRGINNVADRTADQAIAGFNEDQLAGFDAVRANQGLGFGDMDANIKRAKGLTNGVDYTDVDLAKYQNPYTQDVVNTTIDDLMRMRSINSAKTRGEAEAAGAFGGDRAVLAEALNNENLDRAGASTLAQLRQQGFNTSAALAQNDASMRNNFAINNRGLQLAGNDQLARMIQQRRDAASADAAARLGIGAQQQGQDQAMRDWALRAAQLRMDAGNASVHGGTTTYSGPAPDRLAAGLQGLNTGLQFGRGIYDAFNQPQGYDIQSPDAWGAADAYLNSGG